jgi:uncharacterized protein YndB with AHSA1/START domain
MSPMPDPASEGQPRDIALFNSPLPSQKDTTMSTPTTGAVSDTEYVMVREFKAPRDLLYKAYTDPEMVAQWWGQRASTTIVDQMDVEVGGKWRYIQRGDDGTEYAFSGEYLEIVPNEKLVSTFEFEPMPGHVVQDTAEFSDIDGGTRLTVTSKFATAEDLQGMLSSGMEGGANESWDQLQELVEGLSVA